MTEKLSLSLQDPAGFRKSILTPNISGKSNEYFTSAPTSPLVYKSVNLVFNNISYNVRTGLFRQGKRKLLHNISGDFRASELTAIMGLSGAGKSTLMDILAGFTISSVTGSVLVNNEERDLPTFRRSSAYIMQDSKLQPLLTVDEAMQVAADLKLNLLPREKLEKIDEILVALDLEVCRNIRTSDLSGGQKKRLAIALELVNNPPVMFFDEPTSGLDSVSAKQCLGLLKALAREGRTVICTIHQPSGPLFDMIDHLYVIAGGNCVYTGGTSNLVPYLASLGLQCPLYHSPSDFLLEICHGDHGNHLSTLITSIQNGKSNEWRVSAAGRVTKMEEIIAADLTNPAKASRRSLSHGEPPGFEKEECNSRDYVTGFWKQLFVLLKSNAIKLSRDKVLMVMRVVTHIVIAFLVGILYFQIGQDAAYVFDNLNLLYFSIMFLMFSAFNATIITYPTELPIVTREHFNRWYKLRSFYLANKLADLPVQIAAVSTFVLIVYHMTGQLPEGRRLCLYMFVCIVVSLVAQTIGLILGTVMNLQNGVIFGPFIILPFMMFSGFFIHHSDAHPLFQWLFHTSFLKYGFEGVLVAIYGYDRKRMACSIDYCHFSLPTKFLDTVDMQDVNYWFSISILIGLYFVLSLIALIALNIRMKRRW